MRITSSHRLFGLPEWIQVPRTKTYQAESDQKDKMRHAMDDNGIPSKEIHERHRERAITAEEAPDDTKPLQYVPKSQTDHITKLQLSLNRFCLYAPQPFHNKPSFTPPPPLSTPTPPPTTKATNPQSTLPDFTFVFQFNNRVSALEKAVSELREEDHLKTQVTALSSYEAAASLTKFKLKKILIDKIEKSQSYLTATEHRECYDGLIKSYELSKSLFSTYDKVYSLKRSRKDKDKDEDPSARSDRGLKKRKTSKDVEPTKGLKTKESKSGSSKGTKSQSTSFGKSVQTEEPEFEVAYSDMPQNQEGNLGNDDEEPMKEVASKRDWFTKLKQPQEPTDPDWNASKTP
ncbi:hypothetical protein Tco_0209917 [Tanacetum coccineum]